MNLPVIVDYDAARLRERERQLAQQYSVMEPRNPPKEPMPMSQQRLELAKLRSGGAYIIPQRLMELTENMSDTTTKEFQLANWERLKKRIHGLVNKVNTDNIRDISVDLFRINLIRGRGLFARSVMRAQAASLPFTPIYAALVATINSGIQKVGELVAVRLLVQYRRAFRHNDKVALFG